MAAHSEDFVILGITVLIQCQGVTDGQTDGQTTDTSTMAKTREALHTVARKKWGNVLRRLGFTIPLVTRRLKIALNA